MFYDKLKSLCEQRGVKPSRVAIECGFSKGSVSHWKNDGTVPQREILIKIAEYFNVTVDYLLGNEKTDSTAVIDSDENLKFALWGEDVDDITSEMIDDVRKFAQFIREKKKGEK